MVIAMTIERPNTVSGLIQLHREIAGTIEDRRAELARLAADLEAVEHTIRLLDPDAQLGRAKPVPAAHAAFKGEMRRDVMSALRGCAEPATSLQIARHILASRALPDGADNVIIMRKRVGACLWKLRAKGWVQEVPLAGDYKGWRLA